jgi:hypothetical protein
MKKTLKSISVLAVAFSTITTELSHAQQNVRVVDTIAEATFLHGGLEIGDVRCESAPPSSTPQTESVTMAGSVIAAFAGQAINSGLTAVAAAIDEAARATSFRVLGQTTGYLMRLQPPDRASSSAAGPIDPNAPAPQTAAAASNRVNQPLIRAIAPSCLILKSEGNFVLEAWLTPLRGGYVIQIGKVSGFESVPGLSRNRPLPAEVIIKISAPSAAAGTPSSGQVIGIAQIPLGAINSTTTIPSVNLRRSAILPDPGPDDFAKNVLDMEKLLISEVEAARLSVSASERGLRYAEVDRTSATKPDEKIAADRAVLLAQRALDEAKNKQSVANQKWTDWEASPVRRSGQAVRPLTFEVSFVLVRESNRFASAIASALKGTAPIAQTAVTSGVTAAFTPAPAWSDKESAYVNAMGDVNLKTQVLVDLTAAGKPQVDLIRATNELRAAQVLANERAVAASKPIPFPSISVQ